MATLTKKSYLKNGHRNAHKLQVKKLPLRISQQLESIYKQSQKKIKKHPYRTGTGMAAVSVGIAACTYLLINFLRAR